MNKYTILDTVWRVTPKLLQCLKAKGINTIIRYYGANSTTHPQKVITKAEANLISENGMDIAVIFEKAGSCPKYFNKEYGNSHCREAYQWAREHIGQPSGTTIYFAVDFNATDNDPNNKQYTDLIVPYFNAINLEMKTLANDNYRYEIGAYGSGYVVNALKNAGLCKNRWIAGAIGWQNSKIDKKKGYYEILQFSPVQSLCGLEQQQFDLDSKLNNSTDIGAFRLKQNNIQV